MDDAHRAGTREQGVDSSHGNRHRQARPVGPIALPKPLYLHLVVVAAAPCAALESKAKLLAAAGICRASTVPSPQRSVMSTVRSTAGPDD
jgi:hypothetical protein